MLATPPTSYGAQAPGTPEGATLRQRFEAAIPAAAKLTLLHEAALDLVAASVAGTLSEAEQPPSQALTQWLFFRAGAVSRFSRVELRSASSPDEADRLMNELASHLQPSVGRESYGIARFQRGSSVSLAVVFGRRPLDVEPFPKSFAPGSKLTLHLKASEGFTDFQLHADAPGGGVTTVKGTGDAGAVTLEHQLPTQPGRYFIEVSALDPRLSSAAPENPWRRSLLWVPVYVGAAENAAPDDFIGGPNEGKAADAATWGTRVAEVYDKARVAAGKKPLAVDGRVTALAQDKSGQAARAGREPGPDATLPDKLAATGWPPRDYDEQLARGDSPVEWATLRLLQPLARSRITGPDALLIGVGLTARPPAAGSPASPGLVEYAVVEELLEPAGKLEVERDRTKVLAALAAGPERAGKGAFNKDDDVSKAIQDFALEVCKGIKKPNQTKTLIDKVRGVGSKYHSWGNAIWRSGYDFTRWGEQSILTKAKEEPLPYAAVGLCQGDLPGKPGGSYVVVVQYGP